MAGGASYPTEHLRGELPEWHPAAAIFPKPTEEQVRALAVDIAAAGGRVLVPTVHWRDPDGKVWRLDGRRRTAAAEKAKVDLPEPEVIEGGDPYLLSLSYNAVRRHLTKAQRKAAALEALKGSPEVANRALAITVGLDHKTVGALRKVMEAGGEIPHQPTRVGANGVEQPAARPPRPPKPSIAGNADTATKYPWGWPTISQITRTQTAAPRTSTERATI